MPPPLPALPLLIASIGNPAPTYAHTLHSAGHTVLLAVSRLLNISSTFRRERTMGHGLVARPPDYHLSLSGFSKSSGDVASSRMASVSGGEESGDWTLWQSTSLMNVSGKGVREAWDRWRRGARSKDGVEGVLVVVHDELERPLGRVSMKVGGSARGHNGIKSIQAALPNTRFVRIGIGIGRPESREPDVVARYVLRKMTDTERGIVEDCAGEVLGLLRDISERRKAV